MLTREEAQHLENFIIASVQHLVACRGLSDIDFHANDFKNRLHCRLREFTEKPKREVQVGDIYKNDNGEFVFVSNRDETAYRYSIEGIILKDTPNPNASYTADGIYVPDGGASQNDLDLSHRYEIVEVKDADSRRI